MNTVAGLHAVIALLEEQPERVRELWVHSGRDDARMQRVVQLAREAGVRIEKVSRKRLDKLSSSHQGVVAQCHPLTLAAEAELELRWQGLASPRLLLALDGISDPRNLGACLRSAEAAGVQAVLLPRRRAAPLNDAALKAAAGAAERLLLVEVANLARRLDWLKSEGIWVVGAAGEAEIPWNGADLATDVALVMGSEGRGLRELTRKKCDVLVSIPMSGAVGSLNVSVATGILLFEAVRQRRAALASSGNRP
ncbi:MAG: 23S rRNA (guanosine(2251)-2'-O)-methyltransferase RlmB [Pseudomonadales bacterium]|mgnify:CR=1 FL=1|jgi:23S rRNA (guanosine2251-2'-O)-methyltransferase|nr:23S rRNA (guanosine(2251)-2'-O)-methyltransferase RlmB [Pseudomonadales bacterium]MDP6469577.1 23S rRNA (guanosine(2251)-2'-O)-methyltransferase RlmB [Pseudomonadales bacterium]MDP6827418.1 23S rRNA (guanosine(2251)-2'-O)-methyltransferase RlmB [Pseudomonadales bacterium]MDP6971241.1 23S rRNA (guanosine(2251)-2'-O)-methyltransferase RlmB [Pseudomonadales bacterium]|tara:strand:- start:342 stop:1097 length:756 start_codon:yes stop_codon:yes gene_type:complete